MKTVIASTIMASLVASTAIAAVDVKVNVPAPPPPPGVNVRVGAPPPPPLPGHSVVVEKKDQGKHLGQGKAKKAKKHKKK
jgi:hypothetical protein